MINIASSIMSLMEDIWKLSYDMNIYDFKHVCREVNRTANYYECLISLRMLLRLVLKIIIGLYLIYM